MYEIDYSQIEKGNEVYITKMYKKIEDYDLFFYLSKGSNTHLVEKFMKNYEIDHKLKLKKCKKEEIQHIKNKRQKVISYGFTGSCFSGNRTLINLFAKKGPINLHWGLEFCCLNDKIITLRTLIEKEKTPNLNLLHMISKHMTKEFIQKKIEGQ